MTKQSVDPLEEKKDYEQPSDGSDSDAYDDGRSDDDSVYSTDAEALMNVMRSELT